MRFEDFRAGTLKQQFHYRSFTPSLIHQPWTWTDAGISAQLEEASRWLGELNAFGHFLPDVDFYIKAHVLKEANTSSKIEGTQTGMETAALPREAVAEEVRDDWTEVHNYVAALNHAVRRLETLPLSNRLLRETHAILLRGVRGEHKAPGEFRRSQNWIGGSSPRDAAFVPPHADEVPELMGDLERLWHDENLAVPHLIRAALSHYQFETIHPFLDGNGRLGRLLITLYLRHAQVLTKPCLYLSEHLEQHRAAYFDALMAVRTRNDLIHWIKFFLEAVSATSRRAVGRFRQLQALREELNRQVLGFGRRAPTAQALLDLFYGHLSLRPETVAQELRISPTTAGRLLQEFADQEIVHEITGRQRGRLYLFRRYLSIFGE